MFSALVAGGVRKILDNKVSEQLSSNSSNHNPKPGLDEDYVNVAQRLGNEVMLGVCLFCTGHKQIYMVKTNDKHLVSLQENDSSVKADVFSVCEESGKSRLFFCFWLIALKFRSKQLKLFIYSFF